MDAVWLSGKERSGGPADLKALARHAASVAPLLFDEEQKQEAPIDVVASSDIAAETGSLETMTTDPFEGIKPPARKILAVAEPDPKTERTKTATPMRGRQRQQLHSTTTGLKSDVSSMDLTPAPGIVSNDELAALERENRELKTELAFRLQQENLRLHLLIERFDPS